MNVVNFTAFKVRKERKLLREYIARRGRFIFAIRHMRRLAAQRDERGALARLANEFEAELRALEARGPLASA